MSGIVLGAGAALTAGGIIANSAAQDQVAGARAAASNTETARQAALNNQIFALAGQSANRYQNFDGQMGDRTAQLSKFYDAQGTSLPPSGATAGTVPASTSALVRADGARQMAKVDAYTNQQRGALANLRSFGDVLGGISRDVRGDEDKINVINSFKRGSSAVLPLELSNANTAGNGLKMVGDISKGLGSVAMGYGLGGAGLFGGGLGPMAAAGGANGLFGNPMTTALR